jgi:uncharacterized protein YebE (UPF0316 family)
MEFFLDLLIIFVLRVLDVGMATVRIVLLSRGKKGSAAVLGFFESLVWVLAIARVLSGFDDPARVLAFALGFAAGTYGGALVEEWLAIGQSLLRVIAPVDTASVAELLRARGHGATVVNGDGRTGEVRITFCVVPRRKVSEVIDMIETTNPDAFITVEQTTTVRLLQRHE